MEQNDHLVRRQQNSRFSRRTVVGFAALVFSGGIYAGPSVLSGRVSAAREDDATPEPLSESERDELNRLRTAVAELTPCATPDPETLSEATPEAYEPLPLGVAIETKEHWTVQVDGISPSAPIDGVTPSGQLLQVVIRITNNESERRRFGLNDWVLVDEQGRTYDLQDSATTLKSSTMWYRLLSPSEEYTFLLIYDVKVGAGPSFNFIKRSDPSLQFALTLKVLG